MRIAVKPGPSSAGNPAAKKLQGMGMKSLALYASIVGRKHGVVVRFANVPTAMTDGKQIILPMVVNVGEEKWTIMLRALIDHEIMHLRQTRFGALEGAKSPLAGRLANFLEDCWGEREQAKVYPGSLRSIRAGMDVMVEMRWFRAPDPNEPANPAQALTSWLLQHLRGRHFQMPNLLEFGRQWRALAEPAFGAELLDKVMELMLQVDTCKDSDTAIGIANSVVDLLTSHRQELQQPPSPPPQGAAGEADGSDAGQAQDAGQPQGDAGGHGDDGQGSDTGEPQGDTDDAQGTGEGTGAGQPDGEADDDEDDGDGDGDGARQGGQVGRQQGDAGEPADGEEGNEAGRPLGAGEGTGRGGASGWSDSLKDREATQRALDNILQGGPELPSGEFGDALVQVMIKAGVMKGPDNSDTGNFDHAKNLNESGVGTKAWSNRIEESPSDLLPVYDDHLRVLAKTIQKGLGTRLRDLIQAKVEEASTSSRRGRRLISAKVPRVRAGALDVFRRSEEGEELSTAVHILCDMSGSMWRPVTEPVCAVSAAATCYAVGNILDKFQVPFAWTNFGSSVQSVKSFGARWRIRRNGSCLQCLSGTVLDTPLLQLMPELCARPEHRKLCLIVTDGEPSDLDVCISLLDTLRMLDAEIAVLFLGTEGVLFEFGLSLRGIKVARARDPAELAKGVFEAIENAF